MKKSEAYVSQGELANSEQSAGEKLEAPVRLTPEQLESVAAGFVVQISLGGNGVRRMARRTPSRKPFHSKPALLQ